MFTRARAVNPTAKLKESAMTVANIALGRRSQRSSSVGKARQGSRLCSAGRSVAERDMQASSASAKYEHVGALSTLDRPFSPVVHSFLLLPVYVQYNRNYYSSWSLVPALLHLPETIAPCTCSPRLHPRSSCRNDLRYCVRLNTRTRSE
jgi:hypothetical protein